MVVSTHLKNIRQNGNLCQVGVKKKCLKPPPSNLPGCITRRLALLLSSFDGLCFWNWLGGALPIGPWLGQNPTALRVTCINHQVLEAYLHLGQKKNSGTLKSCILIGFSIINHPFWSTPIVGNVTNQLEENMPYMHQDAWYEYLSPTVFSALLNR